MCAIKPVDGQKRLTNGGSKAAELMQLMPPPEKAGLKTLRCAEVISVMKGHNSLFPYKPKRVANRIIKKKGILQLRTINGLNQYIQDMTRYNSYNSAPASIIHCATCSCHRHCSR